jgi:hypothetical protein
MAVSALAVKHLLLQCQSDEVQLDRAKSLLKIQSTLG